MTGPWHVGGGGVATHAQLEVAWRHTLVYRTKYAVLLLCRQRLLSQTVHADLKGHVFTCSQAPAWLHSLQEHWFGHNYMNEANLDIWIWLLIVVQDSPHCTCMSLTMAMNDDTWPQGWI